MKKFNIMPVSFVAENREAKSAEDAVIDFATTMDLDMNSYFKAVPSEDTSKEIAKQIVAMIRSNKFDTSDIIDIYNALKNQDDVLGGKLWTRDDIGTAIVDGYCDGSFKVQEAWLDEVQNNINADVFDDSTDAEWNAISEAIAVSDVSLEVTDIVWDVDRDDFDDEAEYDAVMAQLPENVKVPLSKLRYNVEVVDYLSDTYDYCIESFSVNEEVA